MLQNKKRLILAVAALIALGLVGCGGGGDTDGGSAADQNFNGTQFVPTDENSGTINVDVKETQIAVSEIAGFSVAVRDSQGSPVPGVRISCDSELGVAIIEPTTGSEITDDFGQISGKIGCAAPGSYQFGCRLPIGGNQRKFVTIICSGDVPTGFSGFTGAAGGTLGSGGVVSPDNGGPGGTTTGTVRITAVSLLDNPASPATEGVQVDVNQDICTADDVTTPASELVVEPFGDTFIKLSVVNNSNSTVRFTKLTYTVPNPDGTGRTFVSSGISFIGEATAQADGGEVALSALAFSATGTGADKFLVNATSGNRGLTSVGFRNVKFTVSGTNAQGEAVSVSGTTALSFANYNRCS